MEPTTRWETAALRARGGRPRPRTTQTGGDEGGDPRVPTGSRPVADNEPAPIQETGGGESEALLVPLSAWNRMLDQLGNLHEAGRELAEARERAARAETEAAFLRERLADLRAAEVSPQARADARGSDGAGGADTVGVGADAGSGLRGVGRRAAAAAGGWIRRRVV